MWRAIASLIGAAAKLAAPSDPPIWLAGGVFIVSVLATTLFAFLAQRQNAGAFPHVAANNHRRLRDDCWSRRGRLARCGFCACVLGLVWACLWRGHLRWGGFAFVAASIGFYLAAPAPVAAFDNDIRTRPQRRYSWRALDTDEQSHALYLRTRPPGLDARILPTALARLAQPESCTPELCIWRSRRGLSFALATD